jgi:hypothetical protein
MRFVSVYKPSRESREIGSGGRCVDTWFRLSLLSLIMRRLLNDRFFIMMRVAVSAGPRA